MIYLGTSGFSYDDWKGHFYPERIAKGDMLAFYAKHFDCVEINSTYYAIPPPAVFASMVIRTPDEFRFTVKANKELTHLSDVDLNVFNTFFDSIMPLIESKKLGCVLAQFPWSFKYDKINIEKLKIFRDRAGGLPVVVEFRNSDWVNADAFELLHNLDLGFCCVDEPALNGLMPKVVAVTSRIGYIRFHGRNSKQWFKHEESYQRYDYLYKEEELQEWVPRTKEIESRTQETYVLFNNHFLGQSVRNAVMYSRMLSLKLPMDGVLDINPQMSFGYD